MPAPAHVTREAGHDLGIRLASTSLLGQEQKFLQWSEEAI